MWCVKNYYLNSLKTKTQTLISVIDNQKKVDNFPNYLFFVVEKGGRGGGVLVVVVNLLVFIFITIYNICFLDASQFTMSPCFLCLFLVGVVSISILM